MKYAITFLAMLWSITNLSAQCNESEVLSWHFPNNFMLDIAFDAPESVSAYEIVVKGRYDDSSGLPNNSATFEGVAEPGFNSIQVNAAEALPLMMNAETYFYEVLLRTSCSNGDWSAITQFYASPFSLRNDPGFNCEIPFTTIQYLADGAGFMYETTFLVPPDSTLSQIEDLGILVDVGHTYNGDLSISLTSPQGTEVQLLPFPNGMASVSGLSLYFSDTGEDTGGSYPQQGIVQPATPLSTLQGEPSQGVWTLQIMDNLAIDNGFVFGGCFNLNSSPCLAGFEGSAWFDLDGDGEKGETEPPFANRPIYQNLTDEFFFTSAQGEFVRCHEGGTVELSIPEVPLYFTATPDQHAFSLSQGEFLGDLDFVVQPIGTQIDLQTDVFSYMPDRPGFSTTYYIQGRNEGNTCVEGVEIELDLDYRLSVNTVNAEDYSLNDNVVTVEAGTLCPFEEFIFTVNVQLSDTVSIGSLLESTATISPVDGDVAIANNVFLFPSTVQGAYDPNDKQVNHHIIHPEFIQGNHELTYHVRFQNTGTFYAERVVIADTIDPKLDLSTFQLVSNSHDVEISNVGNVLYFTFDNIMLPDSNANEPESHGHVRYRIRPLPTLAVGETIQNTAYIYFDFNEPIITNTVSTVLEESLGIEHILLSANVHPNPTRDIVNIALPQGIPLKRIVIFDVFGRLVKSKQFESPSSLAIIDLGDLSNGTYVIQIESNEAIKPLRVVKI